MNKNAIVQIFIKAKKNQKNFLNSYHNNEVLRLSKILTKNYAKKVGAKYFFITKPKIKFIHPCWERFQLFSRKWTGKFNNILFLDTDIFTWLSAPNIFNFIDSSAFNSMDYYKNKIKYNLKIFNTGAFVLNEKSASFIRKHIKKKDWIKRIKKYDNWNDGLELNYIIKKSAVKHHKLSHKWNTQNQFNAYFTHLWGNKKKISPNSYAIIKARIFCKYLNAKEIILKYYRSLQSYYNEHKIY
jgi:hypothetical protein